MSAFTIPAALFSSAIAGATAVSLLTHRCALLEFAGFCLFHR